MKPTRRDLLTLGAAAAVTTLAQGRNDIPVRDGVPRVDYHAHQEADMTVERALALSKERGVKFGLLKHAGVKDGTSSEELAGNDEELMSWMRSLEGKPVFRGIQAEHMNWMSAFSKSVIGRLDYVLGDALTMPDKSGRMVRLWTPQFHTDNPNEFMDRYVDFHVEVMAKQPLDILANPTFLPDVLKGDYDRLWSEARMRKVIDAAVKYGLAIEINSLYRIPRMPFLRMAKAAGLKFSFGSNAHSAEGIGNIDYGVEMYKALGLNLDQFFSPAPAGRKPIEVRHVG